MILLLSLMDVDLFARYGIFSAEHVIGSFIYLSLQLVFSLYLCPIFAYILVSCIISGHFILESLSFIFQQKYWISEFLFLYQKEQKQTTNLFNQGCLFFSFIKRTSFPDIPKIFDACQYEPHALHLEDTPSFLILTIV